MSFKQGGGWEEGKKEEGWKEGNRARLTSVEIEKQ